MKEKLLDLLAAAARMKRRSAIVFHELYPILVEATNFLDNKAFIGTRLWHVEHDVYQIPKCKMCSNNVTWRVRKNTYNTYCGSKCARSDTIINEKIANTNIARYGSNPLSNSMVKEKIKKTMLAKYGVAYISQNQEVKDKKKASSLQRYGTAYPIQSAEIKTKMGQTKLKKYGHTNNLASPAELARRKEIAMKSHGVVSHQQYEMGAEVRDRLLDKERLLDQHIQQKKSLTQIAKELAIDQSTVAKYLHSHGVATQLGSRSQAEMELSELLTNWGVEFIYNTRSIIPPKELDIYIPSHELAIEYCGLFWHSEQAGKDNHYHYDKYTKCKEQGIQLLTIFSDEWDMRRAVVIAILQHKLQKASTRIHARKCEIQLGKRGFLRTVHLQGEGHASHRYDLVHQGQTVAQMALLIKQDIEIVRFACCAHIPGAFSKLLAHVRQQHPQKSIVTFSDNRWSDGSLYKRNGFIAEYEISPDYYYSPDNTYRFHKSNYRHSQLKRKLANYDPQLSEWQNCKKHRILRIWDCGKIKWRLSK